MESKVKWSQYTHIIIFFINCAILVPGSYIAKKALEQIQANTLAIVEMKTRGYVTSTQLSDLKSGVDTQIAILSANLNQYIAVQREREIKHSADFAILSQSIAEMKTTLSRAVLVQPGMGRTTWDSGQPPIIPPMPDPDRKN